MEESWAKAQLEMLENVVLRDCFTRWPIKRIAGVDISFVKDSDVRACAAMVVLQYPSMEVVYERYQMVEVTEPYLSGYLAFREVPHLAPLLTEVRKLDRADDVVPDVVMLDGNGVLHPRSFGAACHFGVQCDIPTIGVAKSLLVTSDELPTEKEVRKQLEGKQKGQTLPLKGSDGNIKGFAVVPTDKGHRPIFVSAGHRVSAQTALNITLDCCLHKIPEPIRRADLGSRETIRQITK